MSEPPKFHLPVSDRVKIACVCPVCEGRYHPIGPYGLCPYCGQEQHVPENFLEDEQEARDP